jgi:hypothetical protein
MNTIDEMKAARRELMHSYPRAFEQLDHIFASGEVDEYYDKIRHKIQLYYPDTTTIDGEIKERPEMKRIDRYALIMIGKKQMVTRAVKCILDSNGKKNKRGYENRSFNGLERLPKKNG